jgi:hypothetical protein
MVNPNFKPGDRVEYCGIEAVVIANHGSTGTVEIPGEGRMTWYWVFQGEPVRLKETKA